MLACGSSLFRSVFIDLREDATACCLKTQSILLLPSLKRVALLRSLSKVQYVSFRVPNIIL